MNKFIVVILIFLFITGCATVPKETVLVSQKIGEGIEANEKAHLELVGKYFEEKREKIDMWAVRVYFPKLMDNLKLELGKANMSTNLTENQYEDIVGVVIDKRDEMQRELEKTRVIVTEKIRDNYSTLLRTNSDLTELLRSAAELKESIEKQVKKTTGIDFDFDKFDATFTNYLEKAGKASNQGEKLYDNVEKYLK